MRKKILALIMLFVFSVIIVFMFAVESSAFAGGEGTSSNPYQITNCIELQEMNNELNANYILTKDIDCSDTINWNGGHGFVMIGATGYFRGTFNGQGYKISNLYLLNTQTPNGIICTGFFRSNQGNISRVGLENVSIFGNGYVGGLVGCNSGIINNSYITGQINNAGGEVHNMGGLAGRIYGNGIIENSYSTAGVFLGGGLIGILQAGTVTNSFWDIETSGQLNSYGGIGKTTAEMKIQSTFVGWDFANIWAIEKGISYPHFILKTPPNIDSDGDNISDVNDSCLLENSTGFDSNSDGCIDRLIDFSDVIESLPNELISGSITNSLVSKVDNALIFVEKDRDAVAINILNAFINQVEAQRGKKISEETANMLIEYANNVIAQMQV